MAGNEDHQGERRSRKERRNAPRLKSIYKWNFDPLGNWWEEKRSGKERRQKAASADETRP